MLPYDRMYSLGDRCITVGSYFRVNARSCAVSATASGRKRNGSPFLNEKGEPCGFNVTTNDMHNCAVRSPKRQGGCYRRFLNAIMTKSGVFIINGKLTQDLIDQQGQVRAIKAQSRCGSAVMLDIWRCMLMVGVCAGK